VWTDSVILVNLIPNAASGQTLIKSRLTQEWEFTVTCSNLSYVNWQHDKNVSQLTFLQNLKYRSKFENKHHLLITQYFEHSLGLQLFFDSLSKFQIDDNSLDTRIEFAINKSLTVSFLSHISTRLFNGFDYEPDTSGNLLRTLNSSFLTPLLWTFSGGMGWTVPRFFSIHLGLSGAKLTYVRDKKIYENLGLPSFYGVDRDNDYLFEYGLSMQLVIDKEFCSWMHWDCDILIFKEQEKPPDLILKNRIGVRINKFLKTTIQTRIYYEEAVSKKVQMENIIAIGFYLRL